MTNRNPNMPERVAAIVECGFAAWATDDVDPVLLQNRLGEHPAVQRTKRRWSMAGVG